MGGEGRGERRGEGRGEERGEKGRGGERGGGRGERGEGRGERGEGCSAAHAMSMSFFVIKGFKKSRRRGEKARREEGWKGKRGTRRRVRRDALPLRRRRPPQGPRCWWWEKGRKREGEK